MAWKPENGDIVVDERSGVVVAWRRAEGGTCQWIDCLGRSQWLLLMNGQRVGWPCDEHLAECSLRHNVVRPVPG